MRLEEANERALAEPKAPPTEPPTEGQLKEILEAARLAPSAYNVQPWQFRVLDSSIRKEEVAEAFSIPKAPDDGPAWILCLMDRNRMLPVADPLGTETYIALGALVLNVRVAAAAQGLACRVVGPFESRNPPWRPRTISFAVNLDPYFVFIIGQGGQADFSADPRPAVYRLNTFQSQPKKAGPSPKPESAMDALECVRLRRVDREALGRGDSWAEDSVRILSAGRRALEAHGAAEVELLLVEDDEKTVELTGLQEKAWRKAMTDRHRLAEISVWLRFSRDEWKKRRDGELVRHFGLGPLKGLIAKLGLSSGLAPLGLRFGAGRLFIQKVQASPETTGAFLTTVLEDPGGRFSTDDLYRRRILTGVGACLEAIWLRATSLGASLQFQTSTMVMEEVRAEVRAALEVPETHELLSLIRMGYPVREMKYTNIRRDPKEITGQGD